MKEKIEKLKAFHKAFGAEDQPASLRYELMREENEEYLAAALREDTVEIADALGDMLYVLCGTISKHGMEHIIDDVFNEIHESNMSKLDDDGNPIINGENGIYDESRPIGKILKSKNYRKPNIKKLIN